MYQKAEPTVKIFSKEGDFICEWPRATSRSQWSTDPNHLPENYREISEWNGTYFTRRAMTIGPNTGEVIKRILASRTLTSIPGIGPVYSAGIIAEIGDISRFESQASVAKYAGLVWSQHQSGDFEAERTHSVKSGNRFLRYYLLEAANSVRRCDPEFRRYYDLKFKEVNVGQHKRALALTARKLVRLIFRLLKDSRLYIP